MQQTSPQTVKSRVLNDSSGSRAFKPCLAAELDIMRRTLLRCLGLLHVVLLWIYFQGSDATVSVARYKGSQGHRLKDEEVTTSYSQRSVMGCLAICDTVQGCVSVSWHRQTFECLVSTTSIEHGPQLAAFTDALPPWISYGKMHYRVWHVQSPSGRYSMTREEASNVCGQGRGRLATRLEVLEARALGFEMCSCSWMSDVGNGFVIQNPNICWYTFSTGILYCDKGRADGFCIDDL